MKKISRSEDILKNLVPIEIDWEQHRIDLQELVVEQQRKQEETEQIEKDRIAVIICPVCNSQEKHHHTDYKSNGIIGPGYKSWLVNEYFICLKCGVHYSDITKPKK